VLKWGKRKGYRKWMPPKCTVKANLSQQGSGLEKGELYTKKNRRRGIRKSGNSNCIKGHNAVRAKHKKERKICKKV